MRALSVGLGDRSYPIFIGSSVLQNPECLLPYVKGRQVMIVTNETVAPLYLSVVKSCLEEASLTVDQVILPDGEQFKTLSVWSQIFDTLLEKNHDRRTTLVALGGGVVGDMCGYAAASYQRGVNFIQIPTTLLSQVDSSVGGKTGVNHPLGKNMIGAFYQPQVVVADTSVLSTLPDREFSAGIAEVIKYGLIRNYDFFEWLESNVERLMAHDNEALAYAVERSCQDKADVVEQDEFESGVRATLNLGHTFGHAIESSMGYGVWLHGEAVAAGMVMAADLSARHGWLSWEEVDRIVHLLKRANLPVLAPDTMSEDDFLRLMLRDKKVLDGRIRLVLLNGIGKSVVTDEYKHELLLQTINAGAKLGCDG